MTSAIEQALDWFDAAEQDWVEEYEHLMVLADAARDYDRGRR